MRPNLIIVGVVGIAKLSVDDDASCNITHAYQLCLLDSSPVSFRAPLPELLHSHFDQISATLTETFRQSP